MRVRSLLLIAVLLACGLATAFRDGVTGYTRPTEAWLEDKVPARVGAFTYLPSLENPKQSYRMDESNYKALNPIGIVCRTFAAGARRFDVVVIAGDEPNTFHDQTWCFRMQGWTIAEDRTAEIPTSRQGVVPARLIRVASGQTDEWMVFVFRGPSGRFYPEFGGMWRDTFVHDLLAGHPTPTSFLRVIGLTGQTPEAVLAFAGEAIDAGAMPVGPTGG